MNKKHIVIALAVGLLLGAVFNNRIRALPVIGGKIPSF